MRPAEMKTSEHEQDEARTTSERVTAALKWFNNPKGFGFVIPENENIDAFIHITTLQRADIQSLNEGARLLCEIQRGPKGALVTNVIELVDAGQEEEESGETSESQSAANGNATSQDSYELSGNVKWYKKEKGFGFIIPDDGMKDIFIHKTCLERHGIDDLKSGQRVNMIIKDVAKGREVISFSMSN